MPDNPQAIYQDFTPPKYLNKPRGTNLLVSKQERLRNQGLLTAIQVGLRNYGKTMVVYGAGHFPEVAQSLNTLK